MNEGPSRDARPALDRERVVRVALALLDEVGLDELSMRRLAERLGVTAAALYWYVRNKNELLDLLADAISAEMPLPNPNGPWRAELEALARGARRVAAAHRDAARILVATLPTGPARLRAIDAILGLLLHAGFTPDDAADAAWVLNVYGVGFMLDEALGPGQSGGDLPALPGAPRGDVPLEGLTHGHLIVEHGAVNLTLRADAALPTLYQLTFEGRPPEVEAQEGTVRLRQRHGLRSACTLTLAGGISWDITISGGAGHLDADLRALQLAGLHIAGGVSQTTLRLAPPVGTVPVSIGGGANTLRVERPANAPVRLHMKRGSSHITLDGTRLNAVGGGTEWASPEYVQASDRYNVELGGGASEVNVSASVSASALEPPPSTADDTRPEMRIRNWFAALSTQEYPHLVALADAISQPDTDRRFEFGLQMLLDGLERRLAGDDRQR